MNRLSFSCPRCGQPITSNEDTAGQLVDCSTCGQTVEAPLAASAVPSGFAPKRPAQEGAFSISLSIPNRLPYEGKATQKQKHKIWSLGFRDRAVIDSLGKNQASAVIDQLLATFRNEYKHRMNKRNTIVWAVVTVACLGLLPIVRNGALIAILILAVFVGIIAAIVSGISWISSGIARKSN